MCNFGEHQTADLFETVGHLRTGYDLFDSFIFDGKFAELKEGNKSDILAIIKKVPQSTPEAIADALGLTRATVSKYLGEMIKAGVLATITPASGVPTLEIQPGADEILKKLPPPKKTEVILRYSYQLRPGVKGPPVIKTTRPFCKRMMGLSDSGRVYSRQDIEGLSQRLGYSVWERAGGPWNNKIHCRHYWFTEILLKK